MNGDENDYEIRAAELIDMVLDAIEDEHPELVQAMLAKYPDIDNPAILSGDRYYKLEEAMASELANM